MGMWPKISVLAVVGLGFAHCAAAAQLQAPPQYPLNGPGAPFGVGGPFLLIGDQMAAELRRWSNEPLPRRDVFQLLSIPHPKSQWIERERAFFSTALRQSHFQVLVAPVQVQGYGLDKATRSLMGARLAQSVGSDAPNSYLAQRALGDGYRSISEEEVLNLAAAIGATKVILPFAGHDGAHTLFLSIRVVERAAGNPFWTDRRLQSWTRGFSDATPPIEVFGSLLPEVLAFARLPAAAPSARAQPYNQFFPQNPQVAIRTAVTGPLQRALILQLFGTLAPSAPARYRERFFEQSLLALDDAEAPNVATKRLKSLLEARALYHLNSRPAALVKLRGTDTPEGRAFGEVLNGNLKAAEVAAGQSKDTLLRLMLEFDLQDMRTWYAVPATAAGPPYIETLANQFPEWKPLLGRRMNERDEWHVDSNIGLHFVLDHEFPVPGFDVSSVMRGTQALGEPIDIEDIGAKIWEHLNSVRSNYGVLADCAKQLASCTAANYIDLLEASALANANRALYKLDHVQGLPEQARDLSSKLASALDGQPDYLLNLSRMELQRAVKQPFASRQAASEASARAAVAAAYFEQGQGLTSKDALVQLGIPSREAGPFLIAYAYDFPPRPYWFLLNRNDERSFTALEYTAFDLRLVEELLYEAAPEKIADVRQRLKDRFHGYPNRAQLIPEETGKDNDMIALEAALRERPDIWGNYAALAERQISERGDYAAAAKIVGSFPGFKDRANYDPVALSNEAYAAGSWFFWRGRTKEAKPLYRIAADLRTGSAASMASAQRLALLDGHYEDAAALALERARRYKDGYAYRDYLSWLFVSGHEADAWSAFNQLHNAFDGQQVWVAADLGHRRAAKRWPDLSKWLLTEPIKSSAFRKQKAALDAALRLNAVDRYPNSDLPEVLKAIEGEPAQYVERGHVEMPHPLGEGMMIVHPSSFRRAAHHAVDTEEPTPIPSHQFMFAQAYVPLRAGRFEEAVQRFDEMAAYYPIEGEFLQEFATYALPYFAWASAKSGDQLGLERFLGQLPEERHGFDYHLATAFFIGLRGDADGAMEQLRTAFNKRPIADQRAIMTEYQWAQACDWLFTATGDTRYRDLALAWIRTYQRLAPPFSWAYALEAKLAPKETDRRRALGFTIYLDPVSEAIENTPAVKKSDARKWFASHNPFMPPPTKQGAPLRTAGNGPSPRL